MIPLHACTCTTSLKQLIRYLLGHPCAAACPTCFGLFGWESYNERWFGRQKVQRNRRLRWYS